MNEHIEAISKAIRSSLADASPFEAIVLTKMAKQFNEFRNLWDEYESAVRAIDNAYDFESE